jgi:MacB-like periplasmic core domain
MRAVRRFFKRLSSWARTRQDEERLRAEIEEHLALLTAENLRSGLSAGEARRQAMLKFGAVEAISEDYRDRKGLPFMETLLQDTRFAVRRLRKSPSFTVTAILMLALGIGATTSIFTLVHAVLLKSLPVANPAELYRLGKESRCCFQGGYSQDKEFSQVSYQLYKYLKDNTKGFSELAAFPASEPLFGVRRSGSSEAAQGYPGEYVSGNYFTMFGVRAYAGRALTPQDDQPGAPPVAVMSYRLWQERYGSDLSVIGSVFNFDDKPFTVVGISPPGFYGDALRGTPPDLFLPLNTEPYVEVDADLDKYDTHWLELIGRIKTGANQPGAIEAEMRVELKQWLRSHWGQMSPSDRANFPNQTLYLTPGGAGITSMREQYQHWLQILMMVSGVVLLIVCANVANLMLVRGLERRRQTSLSMAWGASVAGDETGLHRKPSARVVGRRRGRGDRIYWHALDSAFCVLLVPRICRRPHQCIAFHARAFVRLCHLDWHRSCLRHCAGMDGHARGSDGSAARGQPANGPSGFAVEEDAGGVSGRARPCVAFGGGVAHERPAKI